MRRAAGRPARASTNGCAVAGFGIDIARRCGSNGPPMSPLAMTSGLRTLAGEFLGVHRMAGAPATARYALEVLRKRPEILRSGTLEPADQAMRTRRWRLRVG